jgi:hypothetical protein
MRLLVPFFLMLFLAAFSPVSLWTAALIGAIFFLILGTKELTFIKRSRAYELLVITLLFLGTLQAAAYTGALARIPLAYLIFGGAFVLLRESASRYEEAHTADGGEARRRGMMRSLVGGLLAWEYGSVLAGLPLEYIPRSAALFAGVIALFFLTARIVEGGGRYVHMCVAAALGACVIVFFATDWTL